ncbi:expressed protein [Phakopsora pachyrhizi]|uniref:Expressed protein n=1 Tax=Phakopsora pachyrhizi TaxID=170000 RepID=A0AAV0AIM8_PHAPC|nr:expressed protein [Phakopsora pachyrhizi]
MVDELLVACPFKSKFDCSFVCQRYLIQSHVQSHSCQFAHLKRLATPTTTTTVLSLSVSESLSQESLDDHQSQYEWKNGLLLHQPIDSSTVSTHDTRLSSSGSKGVECSGCIRDDQSMVECPFKRFGCTFAGSSQLLKSSHLQVLSEESKDTLGLSVVCRLLPYKVLIEDFERLERRNQTLKDQFLKSNLKNAQMKKIIECQKSSLRDLAQQINDHTHTDAHTPISAHSSLSFSHHFAHESAPGASGVTSPAVSHKDSAELLESPRLTEARNPLNRIAPKSPFPSSASRMNYGGLHGCRLRNVEGINSPLSPFTTSSLLSGHPFQLNSALGPSIRVSSFLRRGDVITPVIENPVPFFHEVEQVRNPTPETDQSSTRSSSIQSPERSITENEIVQLNPSVARRLTRAATLKHTALPKINTQSVGESSRPVIINHSKNNQVAVTEKNDKKEEVNFGGKGLEKVEELAEILKELTEILKNEKPVGSSSVNNEVNIKERLMEIQSGKTLRQRLWEMVKNDFEPILKEDVQVVQSPTAEPCDLLQEGQMKKISKNKSCSSSTSLSSSISASSSNEYQNLSYRCKTDMKL